MDTKYTKDGRKVRVVGQLNNQETIVQEIYVSGGSEIPAGENFTVTTLLDQPAESWKEKSLRELEERYEKERKKLTEQLERTRKEMNDAIKKASVQAKAYRQLANNSESSQLQTLFDFMEGKITHFFIRNSLNPRIATWDDGAFYQRDGAWNNGRIEELNLVSLMGKSNGDLSFRLNRYSDGSGGMGDEIIPCRGWEEAVEAAQALLDEEAERYLSDETGRINFWMERWQKVEGVKIPDEVLKKHRAEVRKRQQDRAEKLRNELAQVEKEMEADHG